MINLIPVKSGRSSDKVGVKGLFIATPKFLWLDSFNRMKAHIWMMPPWDAYFFPVNMKYRMGVMIRVMFSDLKL